MSKVDDACNRLDRVQNLLGKRHSFSGSLFTVYFGFWEAVDEFCADIRTVLEAVGDGEVEQVGEAGHRRRSKLARTSREDVGPGHGAFRAMTATIETVDAEAVIAKAITRLDANDAEIARLNTKLGDLAIEKLKAELRITLIVREAARGLLDNFADHIGRCSTCDERAAALRNAIRRTEAILAQDLEP